MGEKIHIVEGIRANDRLAFEEIAFDVISVGGTKDEVVVRQDPTFGTWTYEFSGIEEAPLYDPSNPDTHIARGQQQMIFIDSKYLFHSFDDPEKFDRNINIARRSIWRAQSSRRLLAPAIILDTIAAAAKGEEMPPLPTK